MEEAGGWEEGSWDFVETREGRGGSKASGLGEDFSDLGSGGTAEHRARQTKSEVAKQEANEAWEMKKGRAPAGYNLVSQTWFFLLSLLTISTGGRRSMRTRTPKARVLSPAE